MKSPGQSSFNPTETKQTPKIGDYVSVDLMSSEEHEKKGIFMGERRRGLLAKIRPDGTADIKIVGGSVITGYGLHPESEEKLTDSDREAIIKERESWQH